MEVFDLDSGPCDEQCAQINDPDYQKKALKECRAYINQIIREFPEIDGSGVNLRIKSNRHEFGVYYSVELRFDPKIEANWVLAYAIEKGAPVSWDKESAEFLKG